MMKVVFIAVVALIAATSPADTAIIPSAIVRFSKLSSKFEIIQLIGQKLFKGKKPASFHVHSHDVPDFPLTVEFNLKRKGDARIFPSPPFIVDKHIYSTKTPGMAFTKLGAVVVRLLDEKTIDYIGIGGNVFLASRIPMMFDKNFQSTFFRMLEEKGVQQAMIYTGKDSEPAFLGVADHEMKEIVLHVPDNTVYGGGEGDFGYHRVFRMTHYSTKQKTLESSMFSIDLVMHDKKIHIHNGERRISFGLNDMCLLLRTHDNKILGGCRMPGRFDFSHEGRAHGTDVEGVPYSGPRVDEVFNEHKDEIHRSRDQLFGPLSKKNAEYQFGGPTPIDMLSQFFYRFNPAFDVFDKYFGNKGFVHNALIGKEWAFQLLPQQSAFVAYVDLEGEKIRVMNNKQSAQVDSVYKGYATLLNNKKLKAGNTHPYNFFELELDLHHLNTEKSSTSFPLGNAVVYKLDEGFSNRERLGSLTKEAATKYGTRRFVLYSPSAPVPCHTPGCPVPDLGGVPATPQNPSGSSVQELER